MRLAYEIGVGERFWSMTMREFHWAIDGHREKRRQDYRLAVSAALLVRNVLTKKQAKVDQIVKGKGTTPTHSTAAEHDAYFSNLSARMRRQNAAKQRMLEETMGHGS